MLRSLGRFVGLLSLLSAVAWNCHAEPVDHEVVAKLREEGFRRSRVMAMAGMLTDVFGPRFANSPSYDAAAAWTRDQLEAFGLDRVSLEPWGTFGYSWENTRTSVHLTAPRYQPIIGYAVPGCRGTGGAIRSEVVAIDFAEIVSIEQLDAFRGRLAGRIVLTSAKRVLAPNFEPQSVRLSDAELSAMARLEIGRLAEGSPAEEARAQEPRAEEGLTEDADSDRPSREQIEDFLEREGVAALVEPGSANVGAMDKGVVHVSHHGALPLDRPLTLPKVIVAAEHYNRMMRVLERGMAVAMEVEIENAISAEDPLDYNVIGDITGSDLAHEVVMIGGHLDAEPAGTGATDNAAGSAIVMEAMRLLKKVGVTPRRTIRAALWGAEESGLLGSRGYVAEHFGGPDADDRPPAYEDFSVYFNVDWYGRFRGIYLQGNDRARHLFEAWMKPFADVGMSWIVPGNTGGTDHMAFLEVGLPGFQFIQDDLEFFNVAFHTNMDVYDRLVEDDLKQASVILAAFAYQAAMRDGEFPRADGLANGRRWHK